MKDSTLLKLSIITSIIGLIILFYYGNLISPMENSLLKSDIDEKVKISGKIIRLSSKGNISIITISRIEQIDLITFDRVDVSKGQDITIEGKIEEYNGKRNIVISKIEINRGKK